VSDGAWPVISRGLDRCVAVPDERAEAAMRRLADARIVAGETGAAALAGALAIAGSDARAEVPFEPDATVLLPVTEGATDPANYERIVGRPPTHV
jgi:diaminopropionate ammonia-lyase